MKSLLLLSVAFCLIAGSVTASAAARLPAHLQPGGGSLKPLSCAQTCLIVYCPTDSKGGVEISCLLKCYQRCSVWKTAPAKPKVSPAPKRLQ